MPQLNWASAVGQNRTSRRLNKQGCWQIRKPQLGSLSSSSHPLSIQRISLTGAVERNADASLISVCVCGMCMLVTRFFRNDFTGIKASLLLQLLLSGSNSHADIWWWSAQETGCCEDLVGSGDEPAIPFADLGSILRFCTQITYSCRCIKAFMASMSSVKCFKKDLLVPSGRVNTR